VWTVDVDPTSTLLATGAADNTMRLWEVRTGKLLKTWEFESSIRRVEFSQDGTQLLGLTEKRTSIQSAVYIYDINPDPTAQQTSEHAMRIVLEESKGTVAGFSYDTLYVIVGHDDGSVSQWDAKVSIFSTAYLAVANHL
jgi:translation initiation factor 3 subunit I